MLFLAMELDNECGIPFALAVFPPRGGNRPLELIVPLLEARSASERNQFNGSESRIAPFRLGSFDRLSRYWFPAESARSPTAGAGDATYAAAAVIIRSLTAVVYRALRIEVFSQSVPGRAANPTQRA